MESPAYNFPRPCPDCGRDMFYINDARYCTSLDCENLHRTFELKALDECSGEPEQGSAD